MYYGYDISDKVSALAERAERDSGGATAERGDKLIATAEAKQKIDTEAKKEKL